MRAHFSFLTFLLIILLGSQSLFLEAVSAQTRDTKSSKQATKKKKGRKKTMQEKIDEERRAQALEAQERLERIQKDWEEQEQKRIDEASRGSEKREYPAINVASSPSPTPSPTPVQQTQQQQNQTTQTPTSNQNAAHSPNYNGRDYEPYLKGGRGHTGGSANYYGKTCKLPALDYSKFNKAWGKALLDRMSGAAPVKTENGTVLNGPMNFMKTGQALARDIGCPSIDPNDHDQANYIVAAVVIAISCPESAGWNPKAIYDERLSGGVAGKDKSRLANESRGLLQMTKKSDHDPENGCVLHQQSDLDGPITNLMCGLAKIKKRGYTTLISFGEYWKVARKMNRSIKEAVRRECQAGYPNIKAYLSDGRAPASTEDTTGSGETAQ